jgi:hypothetical protein
MHLRQIFGRVTLNAHSSKGSTNDLAVRQCFLELLDAFVGDLRTVQAQLYEAGQSFEVTIST